MNKNQVKSNIFKVTAIIVIAVLLFSFSGCQNVFKQNSDVPSWIVDFIYEDAELMWAYENGYFLEEPITEEIDGTRFVIWAILSDDVLTQLVISAESIEGDECEINGWISDLDGVPIEYSAKQAGYLDYGRVVGSVLYIFTPSPGDHTLTVKFEDRETGSIMLEKEIDFNSSEFAALNTSYPIDKTIETDGGSLKIDKVVYTPSMIYVGVLPSGAERLYDKDFYIQADNKELNGEMRQNGPRYPDDPYYMAFPRPKTADEVELVIPFLAYNKEANVPFSKSDIGQTKSLEGTDLTLKDWRVTDEGLELDILHSATGNLQEILEWTLLESGDKSVNVGPLDWSEPVGNDKIFTYIFSPQWNSDEWKSTDSVTISLIKVLQEGPWTVELPAIEKFVSQQPQKPVGVNPYATMKEAVEAIQAQSEERLYFMTGTFIYDSQESYDNDNPIYNALLLYGEVEDERVSSTLYTVRDTITVLSEQELMYTPEAYGSLKTADENGKIDEYLDGYTNLIHEVVELAKAEGRDIADDAFSMGYTLDATYTGDWFLVSFDQDNLQAAYNIKTEELVVSEDMTSLSISDGVPSLTP